MWYILFLIIVDFWNIIYQNIHYSNISIPSTTYETGGVMPPPSKDLTWRVHHWYHLSGHSVENELNTLVLVTRGLGSLGCGFGIGSSFSFGWLELGWGSRILFWKNELGKSSWKLILDFCHHMRFAFLDCEIGNDSSFWFRFLRRTETQ